VFNQLTQLVAEASLWAYGVIMLFALLDALVPVVPSEATVITAGVVAANGKLWLPLVMLAAAAGAWAGDNIAYFLGYRFGDAAKRRFFKGEKAKTRLVWTERQLDERGGELIIVGRFIPGGRTAVALGAGLTRYYWPKFAVFDLIAAVVWAGYAAGLGFIGGKAFEDAPWKGLVLAFSIAGAVAASVEGARWVRKRRRKS
jgi:membrane protein DedA with SNARE-associated domain